jgi:acyl phosphate:glycerol-3-phosphate acyltransferase
MASPAVWVSVLLGSYFLGAIPTGFWLGKAWKGIDVRQHGSGNLGATNVFRVLGTVPGIVTLVLDIFKGAAPVLLVKHFFPGMIGLAALAGVVAIVGHTTSPFVGFHGGKGVATSAGVFGALLPLPAAIAMGVFAIGLAISRRVSVSSICAAVALAIAAFHYSPEPLLAYAAAAMAVLIIWTHRGNIQRIIAGTEPRLGSKGPTS